VQFHPYPDANRFASFNMVGSRISAVTLPASCCQLISSNRTLLAKLIAKQAK
jgi:hypothetical protein